MHHTWGKPDQNQAAIVAALRKVGVSVLSLSALGRGCPDLLCSYRGYVTFLELKIPGQKLTPAQVRWHAAWDSYSPIFVVETPNDALDAATNEGRMPRVRRDGTAAIRAVRGGQ